jgi:hypothetical protein
VTPEEERARRAVRAFLERSKSTPLMWPENAKRASLEMAAKIVCEHFDFYGAHVIALARGGNKHWHSVIEKIATDALKAGRIPPEPVLRYHLDGKPKFSKVQDKFLSTRNFGMLLAVQHATEILGNDERACEIVCDELQKMDIPVPAGTSLRRMWVEHKRSRGL